MEDIKNLTTQIQNVDNEIKKLEDRKISLIGSYKMKLREYWYKQQDHFFTILIKSKLNGHDTHYGCFSTYSKARDVVVINPGNKPLWIIKLKKYNISVGVQSCDMFTIDDLENMDKMPIWNEYDSD